MAKTSKNPESTIDTTLDLKSQPSAIATDGELPEAASMPVAPAHTDYDLNAHPGLLGRFIVVEWILRDRAGFFDEIRAETHIWGKIRALLVSCVVFFAIYGAVMGSSHSVLQAVSSMVKLPILFLLTLAITLAPLYFFSTFFGSMRSLAQTIALMLTTLAATSVLLMSFAPVTLFFLLTTSDYAFFILLNVVFFSISGVMGLIYLRDGVQQLSAIDKQTHADTRRTILWVWMALYAFVGSQMAITISPFVGRPDSPFMVLREGDTSFFLYVLDSISTLLGLG